MNLFVLARNPRRAARYHCDKHVTKMAVEALQLLFTACDLLGWVPQEHGYDEAVLGKTYRPTHRHHPCTRWVAQSRGNFTWAARLGLALVDEYVERRLWAPQNKTPKLQDVRRRLEWLLENAPPADRFAGGSPRTDFVQAITPEVYRDPRSAVRAYRRYYAQHKPGSMKAPMTWSRDPSRRPAWFSKY